jgi:hypothetical protein
MTILRQGGRHMNVSLTQAIEIHAKALKHRFGKRAALLAEEKAHHCAAQGDDEGYAVAPSRGGRRRASMSQELTSVG